MTNMSLLDGSWALTVNEGASRGYYAVYRIISILSMSLDPPGEVYLRCTMLYCKRSLVP